MCRTLPNFRAKKSYYYSVFHRFRQAKFENGSSILSLSHFLLLPQLPPKNEACFKSGQNWLKNNQLANNDLNPCNSLYYFKFSQWWRFTIFVHVVFLAILWFEKINKSFKPFYHNTNTPNDKVQSLEYVLLGCGLNVNNSQLSTFQSMSIIFLYPN